MIPLPPKLAKPAQRALANAGIAHLEQVAEMGEANLLKLHGIGPNAVQQLREAMRENNLSFRET
jgi:hypothetical protein